MTLKTTSLLLVFAALALFSVINWNSFMAPARLWFLVTSVDAPLGLVMLVFIAIISLMFLVYIIYLQATQLSEVRRFTKELKALKGLAEQSELSRIKGLEEFLKSESTKSEKRVVEFQTEIVSRFAQLEKNLRGMIEQSGNGISAYIGEIEDRLVTK